MIIGKRHIEKLKLKKTDLYFILAGIFAVLVDYLVYIFINNYFNISLSKGISFFCGVIISWLINSTLTFKTLKKKLIKFIKYLIILVVTMFLNINVNLICLGLIQNKYAILISFLIATSCSTIANFIFFKYWVFEK